MTTLRPLWLRTRRWRSSRQCRTAAILVLALLAAGGARAQPPDYVIGPEDLVAITVWDQEALGGKFAVEADGTFAFPLIGRVKAGGLTIRALEAELTRRLADGYFVKPQVTLAVEQYRSQRVFVVGEVRNPGTYALTAEITLIEALARAGSTLASAGDEAVVVRPASGRVTGPLLPDQGAGPQASRADLQATVIRVDIRMLQQGVLTHNVPLRDGDTVFVPRASTVFVSGQVRSPGEYAIRREATVRQALTLAGGLTDRGSMTRIKIVRLVDERKEEIRVGLDDVVRPGDIVIVDRRFF